MPKIPLTSLENDDDISLKEAIAQIDTDCLKIVHYAYWKFTDMTFAPCTYIIVYACKKINSVEMHDISFSCLSRERR